MTRLHTSRRFWRLTRFSLALVLVGGGALFRGVSTTHAAVSPPSICVSCPPPPPPPAPTISVTADGLGHLTVTGQNFTPGGQVTIMANMPSDGMGGGGTTTTTVVASLPFIRCYGGYYCYYSPGGTIATTVRLTFSCGSGLYPVAVQAYDLATASGSNPVSIFPWSTC